MKCLLVMMTAVAAVTISGQECSADVSPSGLYVGLGTGWSMIDGTADFDGFPQFSPDGHQLVWASNRFDAKPGETNIFIADWKN